MFDQTFVDTHARTRKPWTFSASIAMQTGIVALVLIVPLMHPEILHPNVTPPLFMTLRPAHEPPPPQTQHTAVARTRHGVFVPTSVPRTSPSSTPAVIDAPDDIPFAGGIPGANTSGIVPGLNLRSIPDEPPPPRTHAEPVKPAPPSAPVNVSTGVQAAKLIFGPKPEYPQIAKISRTQGIVRIQAVVATDGAIKNLKVISGPPLLLKAAVAAVSQWRYQPTFLSGVPVEVLTEIDVNFTLSQ